MLFVWLTMLIAVAGGQPAEAGSVETPRTFCGRHLADARALYCSSMSADDSAPQKREDPDLVKENVVYQENRGLLRFKKDNPAWPLLPLPSYEEALRLRGKRMPGLVDECCLKPCYTSELLSYC